MGEHSEKNYFVRGTSLLLTFCTGLSALVYEVTWQRYLANFLGSAAQATAVILAVFLGGLCIGYHLFGGVSRRFHPRSLVLFCGLTEIAIGLWAMVFPSLYQWTWTTTGVVDPFTTWSIFWEFAVCAFLIGIPSTLMGGTLPLLTQGLSNDLQDSRSFHARIYASNTAGAFAGCLLAGFYFLPNWGLGGTIQTLGLVNIAAGVVLALLGYISTADERAVADKIETVEEDAESALSRRRAGIIAIISGFCSLCLQTVFIRLMGIAMGSSEYAFAMVVAAFVAMLSLGSWLVAWRRGPRGPIWCNQLFIFLGLLFVYLTAEYWPYYSYVIRLNFSSHSVTFYVYHAAMFLAFALLTAFPLGMMGATMPRLFAAARGTTEELGAIVGRLYSLNTVGCVVGALCGGYWFLYFWNLSTVYRFCLLLISVSMFIAVPWEKFQSRLRSSVPLFLVAASFSTALLLPDWRTVYFGTGLFRTRSLYVNSWDGPTAFYNNFFESTKQVFYRDGPNTSVSVSEHAADPATQELNNGAKIVRNLKVNAKSDGETSYGDMRTMRLVGHLPMLLSAEPVRNVGIVGFGLGVSAGSVSLYPEVQKIEIMEISPAVKWASSLFDFANHAITKNPKARIILGDAYRTLMASKEKYSVIISEPSNPWVTGVERLFAKEFYDIVKAKLEPKGIYAQWIHEYSLQEPTLALVLRTFMRSFPHVRVFKTDTDIIMLGSFTELATPGLKPFFDRYDGSEEVRRALAQVNSPSPAALFGLELWITPEQFPGDIIQTLDFPRLALMAAKDFFMDYNAKLTDMLQSTPTLRLWSHAAGNNALITYLPAKNREERDKMLIDYAKGACNTVELAILPNWTQQSDSCRAALATAAADKLITRIVDSSDKRAIELLRQLLDEPFDIEAARNSPTTFSPEEAEGFFDIFEYHDSIFLRLSVEKLLFIATSCLSQSSEEAINCRGHLVRTLAITGYPDSAHQIFESIVPEHEKKIGEVGIKFLRQILAAADEAAKRPNNQPARRPVQQ